MRPALILVAGPAGAGKSYVARAIARALPSAVLIDKDTLAQPLVESLLARLGNRPTDRESTVYVEQVRPLEYETLMATAFELLDSGKIVLATAPFGRELRDGNWLATMRARTRRMGAGVGLIWTDATPALMRERMRLRDEARDHWKLAHWDEYLEQTLAQTQFRVPSVRPRFVFRNENDDGESFRSQLAGAIGFVRARALDPAHASTRA